MNSTALAFVIGVGLTAPLSSQTPVATPRDSALHALNRLGYGATPGLIDRVAGEGVLRWIDRQLSADGVDDPALRPVLARYDLLHTSSADLLGSYLEVLRARRLDRRAGGADSMMSPAERLRALPPEARRLRQLSAQLPQLVVVRAAQSERQVGEVMADFWANHFNIFVGKNLDRVLLPAFIEETIRPRALGSFEDLLVAVARSPAMLVYLDNAQSVAPGSRPPALERLERRRGQITMGGRFGRRMPGGFGPVPPDPRIDSLRQRLEARRPSGLNENYARELMELHTLGVDGGYSQKDVTEVARILTGWSIAGPGRGGGFVFNDWAHDRGSKTVLDVAFPKGHGEDEGMRLLRMLARHPSTMHFISGKLCARFVNDSPPDGCVDDAVAAWKKTGGRMSEVLRAIFHSPDFWAPANVGSKVKTPLEFVVSAVRAVGGVPDSTPRLALAVARLGQPLYQHVAPNGYPEVQEEWVNSGALLNRMNFAVQLAADRLPGVSVRLDEVLPAVPDHTVLVDSVDQLILGGRMTARTRKVILDQLADVPDPVQARALAVGLAIGGPEFQRQ